MTGTPFAIACMFGQQACFALEMAAVHQLGRTLSLLQIVLLRSVGSLLLVALLSRGRLKTALATRRVGLQLLRGVVSAGYVLVLKHDEVKLTSPCFSFPCLSA
jgi:hypothetical protein